MLLISKKLETFPRAHETKMHQCLPYCLWRTCAFEVLKFGKSQNYKKVKDWCRVQER